MKAKSPNQYWMVVLAGCGLIGTCLGLGVNLAGLFFMPIADGFGVGRGAAAMTLTIYNLMHAFTGMAAPKFVTKAGLRKAVLTGTILQAGSTFLLSVSPNVYCLYGCSFLRGLGSGLIGQVTVTILISNWFYKKTALMTSIVMSFTGLSAAVLSPVLSSFIGAFGWRAGYVLLAVITLAFNMPALLLPIKLRPENMSLLPFGAETATEKQTEAAAVKTEQSPIPAAEKVAAGAFAAMIIYSIFVAIDTAFPMHFPGMVASYGLVGIGAVMTSASMVSNTGAKLVLGVLIDKLGAKKAVSGYCILTAAAAVTLAFSRNTGVLILAAFVFGLCFSLTTVALAMLTGEIFGKESYSTVYPKLTLAATVANALFTTTVGYVYDFTGTYVGILLFLCAATVAAMILMNASYKK